MSKRKRRKRQKKKLACLPETFRSGQKLFQLQSFGLYAGTVPVDLEWVVPDLVDDKNLFLKWRGKKIPSHVWRTALSFMKWSYDKHNKEAQCRLYYHAKMGRWQTVVLPQKLNSGMATQEFDEHPLKEQAFAVLKPAGWTQIGTLHHHCNSSSFQSSVDRTDELRQNGLHITVGNLGGSRASFHARITLKRHQFNFTPIPSDPTDRNPLGSYIDDWFTEIEASQLDLDKLPPFPRFWKKMLIAPEPIRPKKTAFVPTQTRWGYQPYTNNTGYVTPRTPARTLSWAQRIAQTFGVSAMVDNLLNFHLPYSITVREHQFPDYIRDLQAFRERITRLSAQYGLPYEEIYDDLDRLDATLCRHTCLEQSFCKNWVTPDRVLEFVKAVVPITKEDILEIDEDTVVAQPVDADDDYSGRYG